MNQIFRKLQTPVSTQEKIILFGLSPVLVYRSAVFRSEGFLSENLQSSQNAALYNSGTACISKDPIFHLQTDRNLKVPLAVETNSMLENPRLTSH